jgi:hypothetical protein
MTAAPIALAAALLVAACGTSQPERPLRDTCAGGACDAVPAGNAAGTCTPPADAQAEDVSTPTTVVGTGTPASCTGEAFVAAVAAGNVITFDCGPAPVTIHLTRTAKVFNDTPSGKVVIDGGGKVTLSGGGRVRILYQDTCDTVGPDVGGGAIRALSQSQGLSVQVVGSTFGGATGLGNVGSNGGALSSIGVSWNVINSLFTGGRAVGVGAIFFVSNDRTGSMTIDRSTLIHNPSLGFETAGFPGIFVLASGPPVVNGSTITP